MSNNLISLQHAIDMTTLYRQKREIILQPEFQGKNILPLSETIGRDALDQVLALEDCKSVRIYYGMKENMEVSTIIVGVNDKNEDILPLAQSLAGDPPIVDNTVRCPPFCPPPSALNT